MGSLLTLVTTLLAGKAVAGLTLVEWEAIAGLLIKYEPQLAAAIAFIQKAEPEAYDALINAAKNAAAVINKPVAGIPGYASDGSVTTIPNLDVQ